jgi:transmembrane sensor
MKISPDVIDRYMAGKCTAEERAMVDQWFQQFDNDLEDSRLNDLEERSALDRKMLRAIRKKITESAFDDARRTAPKRRATAKYVYQTLTGIAAAVVLGLLVYYLIQPKSTAVELASVNREIVNTSEGIERHELPDGSLIWLRPHSKVEFPGEFLPGKREMKLAGEAFFEIARDVNRPFIITTGNVETKVLGTSFNIKAYDDDSSIEVSVLTGKVAVDIVQSDVTTPSASSVLLTPNQRVTYIKSRNTLEKQEPKTLPELSIWHTTDVVFDNVPVRDVMSTLNKKFGVHIQASNQNLLNCLIRADFTDQNLPDILELLSKSVEASYELKNDTIYLSGEGCVE